MLVRHTGRQTYGMVSIAFFERHSCGWLYSFTVLLIVE